MTPSSMPPVQSERSRRAIARFEPIAHQYDECRPRYPAALFSAVKDIARVDRESRMLEVGAGTGIASRELAAIGCSLVCLEPGPNMAQLAREKLRSYPNAEVVQSAFETWAPTHPGGSFDVIFAATAWHWVDEESGLQLAAELLRPGGWIALAWQVLSGFEPPSLMRDLQRIYEDHAPELASTYDLQSNPYTRWGERLVASSLFIDVTTRRFPHVAELDASRFVALADTYIGHHDLSAPRRARLYAAIEHLIGRCGGRVAKLEDAYLHVGRTDALA